MTAQNNVTPNDVAQSIVKRVRSLERISFLRSIDRLKNMMAKIANVTINTSFIVELSPLKLIKLKIKFDITYAPFFRSYKKCKPISKPPYIIKKNAVVMISLTAPLDLQA